MLYDTASWGQWGGQKARRRRRQLLRSIAKAARQSPASVGKRKRKKRTPRFPLLSAWARFMKREGVDDPEHANGKLFRKRFRLPFPVYQKMLAKLEEHPDFVSSPDAIGRQPAPLYLKVLACLRVLGRGECFDTCEELSEIVAPTLTEFFHRFIDWLHSQYDIWVRMLSTEVEIQRVLKQYATLGYPGCLGSIDCCHVHWDRCPADQTNENTGKEGYPSRSFEVRVPCHLCSAMSSTDYVCAQLVCDHTGKILASTVGFCGSWNDKTIVKFDGAVYALRSSPRYNRRKFQVYGADKSLRDLEGLYFICDGGYHHWLELICPWRHCNLEAVIRWSKRLESVRKDVECCFGKLKGRFRILKVPCRFQSADALDKIWLSCCVLHNMIMEFDGLDARWEKGVHYDKEDGRFDLAEAGELDAMFQNNPELVSQNPNYDSSSLGDTCLNDNQDVQWERDPAHYQRKADLVTHFTVAHGKRETRWF